MIIENEDLKFQRFANDYKSFGRLPSYTQRYCSDEDREETLFKETRKRFGKKTDLLTAMLLASRDEGFKSGR